MRTSLTLIVIASLASTAMADPYLIFDQADLGDGLYGVTVSVGGDQEQASWAVNIDFWPAEQIQAFGSLNVNTEIEAETYEPIDPNYTKELDSWIYGDWNALATGIQGLPGEPFHIHAGTPGGQAFGTIPLCYIVTRGCSAYFPVCWEGVIARQGVDYPTRNPPEPGTMALIAFGSFVALRRRRRAVRTGG
jgi:PEP-CTERM motif